MPDKNNEVWIVSAVKSINQRDFFEGFFARTFENQVTYQYSSEDKARESAETLYNKGYTDIEIYKRMYVLQDPILDKPKPKLIAC